MKSFDSRDTIPTLFLLEVTNACRQMKPGEKLEIIANDANITNDLRCILSACQHELKMVERRDDVGNAFQIWLIERPRRR